MEVVVTAGLCAALDHAALRHKTGPSLPTLVAARLSQCGRGRQSDSASSRVTVLDATKLASMRRKTYVADKIIPTRNSCEQPSQSGYIPFPLKRSRIALSTRKKLVVLNFLHSPLVKEMDREENTPSCQAHQ